VESPTGRNPEMTSRSKFKDQRVSQPMAGYTPLRHITFYGLGSDHMAFSFIRAIWQPGIGPGR